MDSPTLHRNGLLTSLQGGRALAALLVIFFHNSHYIFILDKYWGKDPTGRIFDFSHAGVEFFFVLSGFIILHVHWDDLNQPSRFLSYAKKRFLRIYPMYWLILAVIIPVYFLIPSFGFWYHRAPDIILSSILLVYFDDSTHTELAVAWSLYHEVFFYLIFSLAILSKRIGLTILAAWMLACAASFALPPLPYPFGFLASPLNLLFSMGMLACWVLKRGRILAPALLALAGIMLFIAAGLEEDYIRRLTENARNIVFGAGSALAVAGLVELERQGRLRVPALLQLMGNASYSIYLTHFTVLSLLAKIFITLGAREALPAIVSYFLLAALAVAAGIAVHLCVERPLLRILNRRFVGNRMTAAPASLQPV